MRRRNPWEYSTDDGNDAGQAVYADEFPSGLAPGSGGGLGQTGSSPFSAPGMPSAWGGPTNDILGRIQGKDGADPNQPMAEMMAEAFRLRDEGERRRQQTLGFLDRERNLANVPTLTDEDIRRATSRESDRFAEDEQQGMRDLRAFMGASGITGGGMPAGMAGQFALQRSGQMLGVRRDMRLKKAEMDAMDRAAHFQRGLPMAQLMNEDPNMAGIDALTNMVDWRTNIYLGLQQIDVARQAARAQKDAGKMGLFGDIAQGILGLV